MDKFCLKFETNIREQSTDSFDVILATDDGQQIRSHKMSISSGSHVLKDIISQGNHCNCANIFI